MAQVGRHILMTKAIRGWPLGDTTQ